ncbi:unnamed protein product [Gongylonema pulchrum]|uniref:Uncharacterized protein n=1 Tax=Gongylonema pulchrum TaxID=637853 RepID=A0A183EFC3_9BILA|nr:unnamed protein product [Gongylonema pulchrum]
MFADGASTSADALSQASRAGSIETGDESNSIATAAAATDSAEPFGASCLWAGRNAAAKFLQPPIVKRRSLFALYSDLDQLPIPRNEAGCLLSNASLDVGPPVDKPVVRFVVEFLNLNIKLSLVNTHVQQIEPFFVRMFLYDSRAGRRLSEEFAVDPNGNEFDAVLKAANGFASGNRSASEKSTLEDGINTLPQRVLADKNARKVGHF